MRACQQCGLSVSDTATFCAVCGARFEAPVSTAPPVSRPAVRSGDARERAAADQRGACP